MDSLLNSSDTILLASATFVLALYVAYTQSSTNKPLQKFHDSTPHVGKKPQIFSSTRATLRSFTNTASFVANGYAKYSSQNIPFLVSNYRKGPILIIPPASLKTVLNTPEHVVASLHPQADNISAKYTMRDQAIYPANTDVDVVRKQVTKRFGSFCEDLADEVGPAFNDIWGVGDGWKEFKIWPALEEVAARVVNRAMVGLPLCRHERYLERTMTHARCVLRDGLGIGLLPEFLRPILGPLITWQGRKACEDSISMLKPLVERRLAQFRESHRTEEPSADILQWLIEESSKSSDPIQMTSRRIAHRLVFLTFNSAPPTALTITSVIINILTSSDAQETIQILREEIERVLVATKEGYWTRSAVDQLELLDSTIRESMRISDFGSHAFPRQVSAHEGIVVNNQKIPYGTRMEVPMHAIHTDPLNYANPNEFEPFRFAQKGSRKPLVTLDDTFLSFGYSRHACPGRWFGAHLMKVMIAYLLMEYDFELLDGVKPEMLEVMEFSLPKMGEKIKFRKRR